MKDIGIVRKCDSLGRVTIPKEFRDILGIKENDAVSLILSGKKISIEKYYEKVCAFCGNHTNLQEIKGKMICSNCLKDIQNEKWVFLWTFVLLDNNTILC